MGAMDIPPLAPAVVAPFRVTIGITLVAAVTGVALASYDLVASGWGASFLSVAGRNLVYLIVVIAVAVARWAAGAVIAAVALAVIDIVDTIAGLIRGETVFIVLPAVLAVAAALAALWLNAAILRSR
jgi:hypothetical protein